METKVKSCQRVYLYPIVTALFVVKTILSALSVCLCKNPAVRICVGFLSGLTILFVCFYRKPCLFDHSSLKEKKLLK